VVHVTSSRRSREDEAEDERVDTADFIGLFYPYFAFFVILCPRGICFRWAYKYDLRELGLLATSSGFQF
jgi:hypothetical protein